MLEAPSLLRYFLGLALFAVAVVYPVYSAIGRQRSTNILPAATSSRRPV